MTSLNILKENNIIVKLIAKSQGVTVFTIINMNEGYWLVELILARESYGVWPWIPEEWEK